MSAIENGSASRMNRTRSHSVSDAPILPTPIPMRRESMSGQSQSPLMSPTSPSIASSSLSASLKAFAELSLSPPTTLESAEFQKAYKHARSTSFSSSTNRPNYSAPSSDAPTTAATTMPGMSTSPTSAVSDALPTPPSGSPPRQQQSTVGIPMKPARGSISGASAKGAASQLDGVCEKEELEFEGAVRMGESAPAASSSAALFSNGARWGWPASGGSSTSTVTSPVIGAGTSPPLSPPLSTSASSLGRRPSLPSSAGNRDPSTMMAPLGRVVSAGSTAPAGGKGSDGFGLFRRLSVGGFGGGGRPKPPSPPNGLSTQSPAPALTSAPAPARTSAPAPAPAPVAVQDSTRGRSAAPASGSMAPPAAKPKRRVSPFGERMLRDLGH